MQANSSDVQARVQHLIERLSTYTELTNPPAVLHTFAKLINTGHLQAFLTAIEEHHAHLAFADFGSLQLLCEIRFAPQYVDTVAHKLAILRDSIVRSDQPHHFLSKSTSESFIAKQKSIDISVEPSILRQRIVEEQADSSHSTTADEQIEVDVDTEMEALTSAIRDAFVGTKRLSQAQFDQMDTNTVLQALTSEVSSSKFIDARDRHQIETLRILAGEGNTLSAIAAAHLKQQVVLFYYVAQRGWPAAIEFTSAIRQQSLDLHGMPICDATSYTRPLPQPPQRRPPTYMPQQQQRQSYAQPSSVQNNQSTETARYRGRGSGRTGNKPK
jgi:hypothetical protein